MSRLAKKSIKVPAGVSVVQADGLVVVKGPKGEDKVKIAAGLDVKITDGSVMVSDVLGSRQSRADAGTVWSLISNAILGVTEGFGKVLEIEGVGYRANMEGDTLVLLLGYVNPVRFKLPPGVSVTVDKNVIRITGISKELVGQVAAQIRALKKP